MSKRLLLIVLSNYLVSSKHPAANTGFLKHALTIIMLFIVKKNRVAACKILFVRYADISIGFAAYKSMRKTAYNLGSSLNYSLDYR